MKKLLHERLREIDIEDATRCQVCEKMHDDRCPPYGCDEAMARGAHNLADEIERYYIPRPRFEDGEPVSWDDGADIVWDKPFWDGKSTWHISGIDEDGRPISVDYMRRELNGIGVMENGYVKRLPPKILDADGVEIKVGDTVYRTDPPFQPSKVIDIRHYSLGSPEIVCSEKDGKVTAHYSPDLLTHKEPDSPEKLRDDMAQVTEQKDVTYGDMEAWIDRLSALIKKEK